MVRGKSGVANATRSQRDDGRSTDPPIQISHLVGGIRRHRHRGALYLLVPSSGVLVPARTVISGGFFDGFSRLKGRAPDAR